MPLGYIVYGLWSTYMTEEWWIRTLPLLFGVGSIATTYYALLKINRGMAVIGAVITALLPIQVFHSREFRPYIMAYFFQVLSAYNFLLLWQSHTPKFKNYFLFFMSHGIALGSGFSSIFLSLWYLITIAINFKQKPFYFLKRVGIIVTALTAGAGLWLLFYLSTPYAQTSAQNFHEYGNHNIWASLYYTLERLIINKENWTIYDTNVFWGRIFSPIQWVATSSAIFMLWLTAYPLVQYFFKLRSKKQPITSIEQGTHNTLLICSAFVWCTLLIALIVSKTSVNIISAPRHIMIIYIPLVYIASYWIYHSYKNMNNWLWRHVATAAICIILITMIVVDMHNATAKSLNFDLVFQQLSRAHIADGRCSYLIIANINTRDLISFYQKKYNTAFPDNKTVSLVIQTNLEKSLSDGQKQLRQINSRQLRSLCPNLYYFGYADLDWQNANPSHNEYVLLKNKYFPVKIYNEHNIIHGAKYSLHQE
jgi:hypothetical protein